MGFVGETHHFRKPPKKNIFTTHLEEFLACHQVEKSSVPQSWIHCIRTFAKNTGKRPSSPSTKKTIKRHTNRVMIQFEDICTNKYLNIIWYQPYLTNLDWDHLSIGGLKSLTFEYLVVNWTTTLLGAITYPDPRFFFMSRTAAKSGR